MKGFGVPDYRSGPLEGLDPGIADVVEMLRRECFDTTDSGDGVSKPKDWFDSGEALPYPHVAAKLDRVGIRSLARVERECERMRSLLGDGWVVQASYATDSKSWLLFAAKEQP